MGNEVKNDTRLVDRANFILGRMELNWDRLANKKILDVGAGEAAIAQAGAMLGSSAIINSLDIKQSGTWSLLPDSLLGGKTVQANAEQLPYQDNIFDLIINHASIDPLSVSDEVRVLRPGGEIRIAPIGGQVLEMWNVVYYLTTYRGWPREQAQNYLVEVGQFVENNDGTRPEEYPQYENEATTTLSKEEKLGLVDSLVEKFSEITNLEFKYRVTNPDDPDPDGYLVYKKPLISELSSKSLVDYSIATHGQRVVLPFKTTPEGLSRETMLEEAATLASVLSGMGNIQKVVIAGSLARGKEHPSDIDLVLFIENASATKYFEDALGLRKEGVREKPELFDYLAMSDDYWNLFVAVLLNTQSAVDFIIVSNDPDEKYAKMMAEGNIDPNFLLNIANTSLLYNPKDNTFSRSEVYSERQLEVVKSTSFDRLKELVTKPSEKMNNIIFNSHSHQKRIKRVS